MTINVIHLAHRNDRLEIVMKELESQKIADFKIREGIVDPDKTSRDNDKLLLLFMPVVVTVLALKTFPGTLGFIFFNQ